MGFDLGSLSTYPIVGPIYKGVKDALGGNPDAVKAAYDKQIQASKDAAAQMQQFLLGREANAEQYYGPLRHMFSAAYGTEGLQAPMVPGGTAGMTPLAAMYGGGSGGSGGGAGMASPVARSPMGAQNFNFLQRQGMK